jgi:hypothetical protein
MSVGLRLHCTFAASLPLALLPLSLPVSSTQEQALDLRRSGNWIAAGAMVFAIFASVVAPGVPR